MTFSKPKHCKDFLHISTLCILERLSDIPFPAIQHASMVFCCRVRYKESPVQRGVALPWRIVDIDTLCRLILGVPSVGHHLQGIEVNNAKTDSHFRCPWSLLSKLHANKPFTWLVLGTCATSTKRKAISKKGCIASCLYRTGPNGYTLPQRSWSFAKRCWFRCPMRRRATCLQEGCHRHFLSSTSWRSPSLSSSPSSSW